MKLMIGLLSSLKLCSSLNGKSGMEGNVIFREKLNHCLKLTNDRIKFDSEIILKCIFIYGNKERTVRIRSPITFQCPPFLSGDCHSRLFVNLQKKNCSILFSGIHSVLPTKWTFN